MHEYNLYDDVKRHPEVQQQEALHRVVLSMMDGNRSTLTRLISLVGFAVLTADNLSLESA